METIFKSYNNKLAHLYNDPVNADRCVEITLKDFASVDTWEVGIGNKIRSIKGMPLEDTPSLHGLNSIMYPQISRIIHDILHDPVFSGVKIRVFPDHYSIINRAYIYYSEPYGVGFFEWGEHHEKHNNYSLGLFSPFISKERGSHKSMRLFKTTDAIPFPSPEIFPINEWSTSKIALREARRLCPPVRLRTVVSHTVSKALNGVDKFKREIEKKKEELKNDILSHVDLMAGVMGVEKVEDKSYLPVSKSLRSTMDTYFKYLEEQKYIISGTNLTVVWAEGKFPRQTKFHTADVQENTQNYTTVYYGNMNTYTVETLPVDISEKIAVLQMGGSPDTYEVAGVGFQINPRLFYIYR